VGCADVEVDVAFDVPFTIDVVGRLEPWRKVCDGVVVDSVELPTIVAVVASNIVVDP
jgi:hypothetical protein